MSGLPDACRDVQRRSDTLKGRGMRALFRRNILFRLAALATATALVAPLGGCTPAPGPPDEQSFAAHPVTPAPSKEPAFVGVLERYADDLQAAGASAVIMQIKARTGEWSTALGVRSHEGQEPVQLTDQVQIGDITEAMVAVSVMKLVEEGQVKLDDPIAHYLPEIEAVLSPPEPVTVRSALNHRSGIPEYWDALRRVSPLNELMARTMSHADRLAAAAGTPWPRQRPEQFVYSGSNYVVLALLVERLRGRGIGDVLHSDIVEPLHLEGTHMMGGENAGQRMVHAYSLLGPDRVDVTRPAMYRNAPDSGMISTVPDLNAFLAALVGGKLLKPASLQEMLKAGREDYGLGLMKIYDECSNNSYFGHVGDVLGYTSLAMGSLDGSRQLAIAVATPAGSPPASFNALGNQMMDAASAALNQAC